MHDLLRLWDNRIPVNPIRIGKRIGLEFRKSRMINFDCGFRKHEGRLVGLFRERETSAETRLVTGRLLVRFNLGLTESDDTGFPNDLSQKAALRLLMPRDALHWAIRVSKELDSVSKIASYFDLPDDQVRWRMDDFLGERFFSKGIRKGGLRP